MENLETQFWAAFEDKNFTRSERKEVREMLGKEKLTPRELAVLRSKIFDIARTGLTGENAMKVIQWLENANKLILPKVTESIENEVFFSPGNDCLNAIVGLINGVINKIDICVFTISDNRISKEIEMAHHKGVKVRILSDNDKSFDAGSDIHHLASLGIPVKIDRTDKHMHHKFAIADGKKLLTGSYNWTRSAATSNEENILITNDPQSIKAYQREFDKLWDKMKLLEV